LGTTAKKITRENIARHLIEYQLDMVDRKLEETIDDDKWYFNWTITSKQEEEFRNYAIPLIKKTFKCSKKRAENTFAWFWLGYGLRIKN
jgi:hypothetical protein